MKDTTTAASLLYDTANNDLSFWNVHIEHFDDGITIRPILSCWNLVNIHHNNKSGKWDVYESIPDINKGFDDSDEKLWAEGCNHFQAINRAKDILKHFGYNAPKAVIEPSEGVILRPNHN
jgi:hypothetical protein